MNQTTNPDSPIPPPELPLEPESLVREHMGWMLSLARRTLGDDNDAAEDVVQDAFISAFQALDTIKNLASIKPWLHRVTVNSALMKLRQKNRLAEQSIDEYLPEFDRNDCRLEDRWAYLASVEDVLENHSQQELLIKAFATLPDSYRIALQLRDIEGYSTQQVADALQISVSNAKIRVHRARSAMKKLIEPILRGEIK